MTHAGAAMTAAPPRLRVFDDTEQLASAAAEDFARLAETRIAEARAFFVALAGGNTPRALYRALAARSDIDWTGVHVFFGDERCVPPTHVDSNYRMAQETLLRQVPIPLLQIHRLRGELAPEDAARVYADELEYVPRANRWPCFDLVLLGLGDDGHIASLFPDTAALERKDATVVANAVPRLGAQRLTLTLPVINNARAVWLLVSGAAKAAIVQRALKNPGSPPLPVQRLDPARLSWYLDRAAYPAR